MNKTQRILTTCLWGVLLLTMVGVVTAKFIVPRLTKVPAPEALYPAATFTLTDQTGAAFSSDALRGKPYVASFMFTSCNGICPRMNGVMARLQRELPAQVQLVSFTVDPETDTPAKLKEYAQNLKADPNRWHFLTSTDKSKLVEAAKGMKLTFVDWPASHSDRIVLVDAAGQVRGTPFKSTDDAEVEKLVAAAKAVAAEGGRR